MASTESNVVPLYRERRRKASRYADLVRKLDEINATGGYLVVQTPEGTIRLCFGDVKPSPLVDAIVQ